MVFQEVRPHNSGDSNVIIFLISLFNDYLITSNPLLDL